MTLSDTLNYPFIRPKKHLLICLAMLVTAALTIAITPRKLSASAHPKIAIDTLVPKYFTNWKIDERTIPLQTSPDIQQRLDRIYDQTLARTYINSAKQRVMLSIAYGSDQSDSMQAHKPEVCYPAQGFDVVWQKRTVLNTKHGQIEAKLLLAKNTLRIEPITYWFVTGGKVGIDNIERKLAKLKIGLTGKIPDGLLFRVSSIDNDKEHAFDIQTRFINDLLDSIPDGSRDILIGSTD